MFKLIKNKTNIDFVGKRRIAIIISTVINLAVLTGVALGGLNYGIDFVGGTLVELKFNQSTTAAEVRSRAEAAGLADVSVQGIGSKDENSFLLRLGGTTQLTAAGADKAKAALSQAGEVKSSYADLDNGLINVRMAQQVDRAALERVVEASGTSVYEIREMGAAEGGGFDYQVVAAGMADKIRSGMQKGGESDFTVQRVEYVGPQVGKQLRNRGVLALVYAMLAILVYVAFRFDFKFGPGALVALVHDTIMVTGYYLVTQREFNLTAIAVLLTIIGYSINDTIVIYDRIREDMSKLKGKPLAEIINIAINDMLGRTILTALVTALSLVGLLIFGVGEIFDFAAAMLVGLFVGMYSTIYIATPLTIWLDERAMARSKRTKQGGNAPKAAAANR